ncbi:MAG: hypothetical protein K2M06_04030 [Muribaculaceae bacterium]|nr:hypothetical protein [Muribaculaceae bacterium]
MDKNRKQFIQHLLHLKMQARSQLEIFKILDPKKYESDLDKLLDRINEIDKILKDLDEK